MSDRLKMRIDIRWGVAMTPEELTEFLSGYARQLQSLYPRLVAGESNLMVEAIDDEAGS